MPANEPSQPTVKSAMRTLDLIEYVVARPSGVVAQEISAALAIPVSSLSYLLGTLVERAYLTRVGRRYLAGPGLDRLRRRDEPSPAERAAPLVRALRNQLNETSSFFERDGWEMTASVTETGGQTLRYSIDVGTRTPLHCVAAGKALLAAMPPGELDHYFAQAPRERFTPFTLIDRDALAAQLDAIRHTGVAYTRDEYTLGISGVGAVVQGGGAAATAIGVAVPTPRFTPDVEALVVAKVRETARLLSDADTAA